MAQSDFAIDGTPIKDMSDSELASRLEKTSQEQALIGAQFNAVLQQIQITSAVVNVLRYEINRRANSLQIASSLPGKLSPKPLSQ